MEAVRFHLIDNYGQHRSAITSRQKSPPLVPLGLHGLFVGFHTINPSVVFFCHTFCRKSKKDVCTPTATTVLHLRQKKNN